MADFKVAKEGIVRDNRLDLRWRLLEALKLWSWANGNRDYVADEKGQPLTQRQVAARFGIPFQRVSEAIAEMERDGYVESRGRVLIVVDDPAAQRAQLEERRTNGELKSPPVRTLETAEERKAFFAFWQDRAPHQWEAYQKLGQEIEAKFRAQKELQKAALEEWENEKRKSGTVRTIKVHPVADSEIRDGADENEGTVRILKDPILISLRSKKKLASFQSRIRTAIEASGLVIAHRELTERTIENAAKEIPTTITDERLAEVMAAFERELYEMARRKANRPKGWGILLHVMKDALRTRRPKAAAAAAGSTAAPAPSLDEQIKTARDFLASFPTHRQADEFRVHLAELENRKRELES